MAVMPMILATVVAAVAALAASNAHAVSAAGNMPCGGAAATACYRSFAVPGGATQQQHNLHYYASRSPAGPDSSVHRDRIISTAVGATPTESGGVQPTAAVIAVHGHPRDIATTFNAALLAVQRADVAGHTLVVAPVFQVDPTRANRCSSADTPAAQPGDLLWTCASWMEGGASLNANANTAAPSALPIPIASLAISAAPAATVDPPTAFHALDGLVAEVVHQWPSVRSITIAGFSAGGQMVQHYIGFAAPAPAPGVALRYVVTSPGSWLYFDAVRPQPVPAGSGTEWPQCETLNDTGNAVAAAGCAVTFKALDDGVCPQAHQWKYGTDRLPATLGRSAGQARAQYALADIHYLQGALDRGQGPGGAFAILDKSCAAQAQGPDRLQRSRAYVQYADTVLAPARSSIPRKLVVVPGCGHDVTCVWGSAAARNALLGTATSAGD